MNIAKLLFLDKDSGDISGTKIGIVHGVILFWSWYFTFFFMGWNYDSVTLSFLEGVLILLFSARVVQRSVISGAESIGSMMRRGEKKKEEKKEEQPHTQPPIVLAKKTAATTKTSVTPKKKVTATTKLPNKQGNFSISEFNSHDGSPMTPAVEMNIVKLIGILEVIREACGNKPMSITSGYRSKQHNINVGGAKNSQHVYGRAADFKVKGMTPKAVSGVVERLIAEGKIPDGGVGLYKTWLHYDFYRPRRWNG